MPRATERSRGGFSLVEALVVLSITSLLLVLLFSVAGGARRSGFDLARRADASGDAAIGAESVRVLIRGLRLPQANRWSTDLVGAPDALTGVSLPARATACPVIPGAPMLLRIEAAAGRSRLVCASGGAPATVLLDLGSGPAGFSYALAGRPWTDRILARLPPPQSGERPTPAAAPTLWVRLRGGDGRAIVEAVDVPPPPAGSAT